MCCFPDSFFVLSCCHLRLIRTPHLAPECRGTWMVKCHNSPNCDRATRESNPGSSAWQADVIATRPWCPLYIYEIYFCNLQDRIHSTNYTIALSYFIANFFYMSSIMLHGLWTMILWTCSVVLNMFTHGQNEWVGVTVHTWVWDLSDVTWPWAQWCFDSW